MKNLLIAAIALFFFSACNKNIFLRSEKVISTVKHDFVPDKRVGVFEVNPVPEGKKIILKGETDQPKAKEELLAKLKKQRIKYIDEIMLLPSKELNGKNYGIVNLSVCNIRSKPKHSGELATQALLGTPVKVLKQKDNWFLIQTPDQYISWLDSEGFTLMDKTQFDHWKNSEKVIFLDDFGFVYEAPKSGARIVSDLVAGDILKYKWDEKDWTKVEFPDGRQGYIIKNKARKYKQWLTGLNPQQADIINTAFRFMGRPYLWGGTSGKGLDCSGFTKTVYFLNGILLPRDASQQVNVGVEVKTDTTLKNLQPGDLLFFGRKATPEKKERITHVAIYLGDGKIIHATGKVKVESLKSDDPAFAKKRLETFVRAKRILGFAGQNGVEKVNY